MTALTDLQTRILSYRRFLRLDPFDISTPQGASDERYRRALFSSATMIINRALSLVTGLFTIHVAVDALGTERFAMWNTLIMLISVLAILDFGVPSSLVNRTAQAATAHHKKILISLSVNIILIFLIAIFASAVSFILFLAMPWNVLLNTETQTLLNEAKLSALLVAPILFMQIVNTGLSNIILGLQRGFMTNLITAASHLLTLAFTLLAKHYAPNPAGFLWATQGSILIVIATIFVYLFRHYTLRFPRNIKSYQKELRKVWVLGRSYFAINMLITIAANLDVLLASVMLSPQQLSELVTVQRLFQVFIGMGSIALMPLWSAYADAFARGDRHFIKKTLRRSLIFSFGISLLFLPPIILLSNIIFAYWTQGHIIPHFNLIILVALGSVLVIANTVISVFLNGCGILRPQIVANAIYAGLAIILKIGLAWQFGIYGIVIAGIVAYAISYGLTYSVLYYREIVSVFRIKHDKS